MDPLWIWLVIAIGVLVLVGLTLAFNALIPKPGNSEIPDRELPFVSVIIPARNEETNIGRCLDCFTKQDYPRFEVVVIDDRSVDDTCKVVEEHAAADERIKLIRGTKPPPPGWTGKCNALVQAVAEAEGQWFFFADADTAHKPGALRDALCFAIANKAHMVSFWPVHELGSFWERVIMPVMWGAFFWSDPFHLVNDLASKQAYSIGHCIVIERGAYEAVGGHGSVSEWIIEDHALAKVVKGKFLNLMMADGRDVLQIRMYTGLGSVWSGWSKMLFSLAGYRLVNIGWMLLFINTVLLAPFLLAAVVAYLWYAGISCRHLEAITLLSVLQIGLVMIWYGSVSSHFHKLGWWYFFTVPIAAVMVSLCYCHSAYLVIAGSHVTWKDQRYPAKRLKIPDGP